MSNSLDMKPFVCSGMHTEHHENRYGADSGVEAWKTALFTEVWKECDEKELFGSEHEVMYAVDLAELQRSLEERDPAGSGFSYFMLYDNSNGTYRRDTHFNRIYRTKYPLATDAGEVEILEAAQLHGTVYLAQSTALDIFDKMVIEGDLGHVQPVSLDCIITPKKTIDGLMQVVYAPKRAKTMRSRHTNEIERCRIAKKEREAFEKKERIEANRESTRTDLKDKRMRFIDEMLVLLRSGLQTHLGREAPATLRDIHSADKEPGRVALLTAYLDYCDKLKVGADCFLDVQSKERREARKEYPMGSLHAVKVMRKVVNNLGSMSVLGAYDNAARHRNLFPQCSELSAALDNDEPLVGLYGDTGQLARYQVLYDKLVVVIRQIKRNRQARIRLIAKEKVKKVERAAAAAVALTPVAQGVA